MATGDDTVPRVPGRKGAVIKGLAVLDAGAAARSLLGVAVTAGVAMSAIGPEAAFAAGGAAAIAGAVALQDSPRGRLPLLVWVSVAMGVAVLLGTATSASWVPFTIVVAGWCFWAGMAWAGGTKAGLIAAAASALLVTAPPIAPTWTTVGATAALAVAGGLSQALLIAVWPRRRWQAQRAALTRAYRSLAADARRLAAHPGDGVTTAPLTALRDAFTVTTSQARRRPVAYRDWYGIPERISVTLTALAGKVSDGTSAAALLTAAADVLDAIATPNRAAARAAGAAMTRFDAVAASASDAEVALAARFSAQLGEACQVRLGEALPVSEAITGLRTTQLVATPRRLATLARGQLRRDSPVFRHALRLATAAACGVAIARVADVAHGYWIPLTVVMVVRPETAHTYTRCVGRVGGNVVGVVFATLVGLLVAPAGLGAVALAVVMLACAYALTRWGYLAISASLAAAVVFLMDVSGTATFATMVDRVLATLIGGVLAVLAHVALPDLVSVRLRQRAGELLKAEIDYAATVIRCSVHDVDRANDQLAATWDRALRARTSFEAAAATGLMDDKQLRRWLSTYRAGLNAVTAACATLEANLPARGAAPEDTALRSVVDEFVEALRGEPPTAGTPWNLDAAALTAANGRVRARLADTDDASARVLLGEIDTMTGRLLEIASVSPRRPVSEPTSG